MKLSAVDVTWLIYLVREMRVQQRAYFRLKTKKALMEAKVFEGQVDEEIARLLEASPDDTIKKEWEAQ